MRDVRERLLVEIDKPRRAVETVRIDAPPYWVRVMFGVTRTFGKAVSNRSLPPRHALTDRDEEMLDRLGWSRPGTPCRPGCECRHVDFSRTWPYDTPTEELADALLTAFVSVYLRVEGQPIAVRRLPRPGVTRRLPIGTASARIRDASGVADPRRTDGP
jgi:hypothetical protein